MAQQKIVHRFDPLLRTADDSFRAPLSAFVRYLETREAKLGGRTRARKAADQTKFCFAVECLLVNLAAAYALSPKAVVAAPLSNTVLRGNPRYRPAVYGKHFRDLIALMEAAGLIVIVTKGYNVREWRRSELTTIRYTAKLLKAFPPLSKTRGVAFKQIEPPEVVVLKDEDGQLLDYTETKGTRRWREEMRTINGFLRDASISISSRKGHIDEDGFSIQPYARSLRRIWNNGDWEQGGRLYDAFWQTMKREDRLHMIRIDDGPIANVDFSQFNLRLAYALAKVKPPGTDLYDITGKDSAAPNWQQLREGRKKLTNAMFNRSAPLTSWPGKSADERSSLAACFPSGTTARTAISQIREKHAAIASYFESARGLAFMRIESDILVASLLSLMKRGIAALPIHDAVLVPKRYAEVAKRSLERESERRVGSCIPADIKILGLVPGIECCP